MEKKIKQGFAALSPQEIRNTCKIHIVPSKKTGCPLKERLLEAGSQIEQVKEGEGSILGAQKRGADPRQSPDHTARIRARLRGKEHSPR